MNQFFGPSEHVWSLLEERLGEGAGWTPNTPCLARVPISTEDGRIERSLAEVVAELFLAELFAQH